MMWGVISLTNQAQLFCVVDRKTREPALVSETPAVLSYLLTSCIHFYASLESKMVVFPCFVSLAFHKPWTVVV